MAPSTMADSVGPKPGMLNRQRYSLNFRHTCSICSWVLGQRLAHFFEQLDHALTFKLYRITE